MRGLTVIFLALDPRGSLADFVRLPYVAIDRLGLIADFGHWGLHDGVRRQSAPGNSITVEDRGALFECASTNDVEGTCRVQTWPDEMRNGPLTQLKR